LGAPFAWELFDSSYQLVATRARSPSGKAKVCKTFIGGSIPPRASILSLRPTSGLFEVSFGIPFVLNVFKLPSASDTANPAMHPATAAPKTAQEFACVTEFRFLALCEDSQ
jgi:hypothetical protein